MSESTTLDIVTVGHLVIDLIRPTRNAQPTISLGGPPVFVSLAASKLGARVGVISKVGKGFQKQLDRLQELNVDVSQVHVMADALTTSYALTYSAGGRTLRLRSKAPPIEPCDVPSCLRAKIVHAAPVAGELPVGSVRQLKQKAPVLSLDPQGFMRKPNTSGRMRLEAPGDASLLGYCDIFKGSLHEARVLTGHSKLKSCIGRIRECGVRVILLTMGRNGAYACLDGDVFHIPACKPRVFKDPTGAGDAFAGGFLAEYVRGREPLWCCCVGSAAASFVVEAIGSERFGEKNEVYERATEIYEKGIKPIPLSA